MAFTLPTTVVGPVLRTHKINYLFIIPARPDYLLRPDNIIVIYVLYDSFGLMSLISLDSLAVSTYTLCVSGFRTQY